MLTLTWPGGASAVAAQPESSSDITRSASRWFDLENRSSSSEVPSSPEAATISAGVATGSNVASNRVGAPRMPCSMEWDQKALVLSRCTITSRFDHASHRLGVAHCSSVNSDNTRCQPGALSHQGFQDLLRREVELDERINAVAG